jgi:hypothetical protein
MRAMKRNIDRANSTIASRRVVERKASKTDAFYGSKATGEAQASKASTGVRLPQTIRDFVDLANSMPPLKRDAFRGVPAPLTQAYEWLCQSSLAALMPRPGEVGHILDELHTGAFISARRPPYFQAEEPSPAAVEVYAWARALKFVVNTLEEIVEVQEEPFDANFLGWRPIPWNMPWISHRLEIGARKLLRVVRSENRFSDFYKNFQQVLDGADASRIRLCHVKLRGDSECGRFYWAKRHDQRACSLAHAQLLRVKESIERKKLGMKRPS